jgi:transposase
MDEKDKIITELRQRIETLLKRIAQLEDEVARLKKDSRNSSKPPSSDIVKPNKPAAKPECAGANASGQPSQPVENRGKMSLILSMNRLLLTGAMKTIRL